MPNRATQKVCRGCMPSRPCLTNALKMRSVIASRSLLFSIEEEIVGVAARTGSVERFENRFVERCKRIVMEDPD